MINNFKRILFLFAHPDDETLGAGGTINLFNRKKKDVYVALSSTGINSRKNKISKNIVNQNLKKLRKDTFKALKTIGVNQNKIFFGDFLDNENDSTTLLSLIHWVEDLVNKIKPDTIFTHYKYCTNIDHKYLFNAAVVACRPLEEKKINIISSEIPSSTGYDTPAFEPNFYIALKKKDIVNKINAMQKYSTEKRFYPHPRSPQSLEAYAKVRGVNSYNHYAEAFKIHQIFADD